ASGSLGKHSRRFMRTMRARDRASLGVSQPSAAPTRWRVAGRMRPNQANSAASARVLKSVMYGGGVGGIGARSRGRAARRLVAVVTPQVLMRDAADQLFHRGVEQRRLRLRIGGQRLGH